MRKMCQLNHEPVAAFLEMQSRDASLLTHSSSCLASRAAQSPAVAPHSPIAKQFVFARWVGDKIACFAFFHVNRPIASAFLSPGIIFVGFAIIKAVANEGWLNWPVLHTPPNVTQLHVPNAVWFVTVTPLSVNGNGRCGGGDVSDGEYEIFHF